MKKIIMKTICSGQPYLQNHYRTAQPDDYKGAMCFEILGFDILIDEKLKPWLLEINYTPSFSCGSDLDNRIKQGVVADSLVLTGVSL